MKSITFAEGIDQILREFELPTEHSAASIREAGQLPDKISSKEIAGRRDLQGEIVVTIDGEKARDYDDAVSILSDRDGFILKVSIADVGYYVFPGSPLDQEAYQRGNSYYLPDRCLPMLPEKLSNNLCSLVPSIPRLTVTAEMRFDPEGNKLESQFYRSVIRSQARLTYTEVGKVLEGGSSDRDPSLVSALKTMGLLADKIHKRRIERGSLDFDLPEPEIQLDLEEGTIEGIVRAPRNKAHRLIEEFMIAANESVAEFLTEKGIPTVYRIHPGPDAAKYDTLKKMLHNLGLKVRVGRKPQAKEIARLLDQVRGEWNEKIVNTLLVRSLGQAVYDTNNDGHFGLASKCYTHFTSPIRRYPDLVVHRLLVNQLEGKKSLIIDRRHLDRMAQHCSWQERIAMKAEWASHDLAAAFFMQDKVGEEFPGIISSLASFGLYVELIPILVEGLVPFRKMKGDYYVLHQAGHEAQGRRTKKRFRIGDPVRVKVDQVNLEKRWIDFQLVF